MGNIRIRKEGSAGTHNGMRNIIKMIGTCDFVRIRVGIQKETPMALVDYVLSNVSDDDHAILDKTHDLVADALYDFVHGVDIDRVMQKYNTKR